MSKALLIIGSKSDKDRVKACCDTLSQLGVYYQLRVASAHRVPDYVKDLATSAIDEGYGVIIAAAGMAAALPGSIAAHTTLPVVGIPLNASALSGKDALYAIAQMPPGVPVATVAIDGTKNGAVLAAQILAIADPELRERLVQEKAKMAKDIIALNE